MEPDSKLIRPVLPEPEQPLMQLALEPYDALIELDVEQMAVRTIHRANEAFPLPDGNGAYNVIMNRYADIMVHPDDREPFMQAFDPNTLPQRLREADGLSSLRYRLRLPGDWRWTEAAFVGAPHTGMPEHVIYVFFRNSDIPADDDSDEMQRNDLTGLLPEQAFFEHAKELLREHGDGWCVVVIDLEHFKLFNEWYGREQGDILLRQVGVCLTRAELENGGIACHMGQDDFALLIPYDERKIELIYEQVHGLIVRYGTSVGFLPAFGVCMVDEGSSIEQICDRASMAAMRAKDNYHSRIRIFDPLMYEKADWDYHVLTDFQKAMSNHELSFYLQPQCHIATERIVGAESLVRWRKPDGKMVPPGVFVPVLEEYGFITDMDKFVWEEVCKWQKNWIDSGHTPLPVSVNVSQIDIYTIDVPAFFESLIKKYELPTEVIKIEITESAYVDNGSVADAVTRLREKGFLVLMDDFGSGYSSLNMLRNLNIDVIKLDAQFLRMGGDDRKGIQIMESIVNMATTMGVPIIVEGVETRQETDFLSGLGCSYVQGYYFYRPMPKEDFQNLISNPEHIDTSGFTFAAKDQFHTREFLDRSVFSDAMLNNILGPVAFFQLHGKDVDIVRFNRQLYDEVNLSSFNDITRALQDRALPEDAPRLYELLDQAYSDPLDGAGGVIRFMRADGSTAQFRMQFFFLEEDENSRTFYGSVHDVTSTNRLSEQMGLLTRLSPASIIFLQHTGGELRFRVATHGLERALGIGRDELDHELNIGAFRERLDPREREALLQLIVNSGMNMGSFSPPFRVTAADGTEQMLCMRFDSVHDKASGVEYVLVLSPVDGSAQLGSSIVFSEAEHAVSQQTS